MKAQHLHPRYDDLIAACRGLDPLRTAVVFPCDRLSLQGAMEAAKAGLIEPVLLGAAQEIHHLAHL